MATNAEIRTAGRLAGDALAGAVRAVRHVHMTVAGRAFAAVGPSGASVRLTHDRIADGVYSLVGGAHSVVPRIGAVAAVAARSTQRRGGPTVSWTASGRSTQVLAALNGLKGDTIAAAYPALALTMTVRGDTGHSDVIIDAGGIAAAFPDATSRVAVFVHGLCETNESWCQDPAPQPGGGSVSFGESLREDFGCTPLYVRYNSGLRVSDNGRSLATLIDDVVDAWPVDVEEIVFVGHSMGGLVARSACHVAERDRRSWAGLVRHVFCLGTPHLGAPLERSVDRAARFLALIPEAEPLATFLGNRSIGVKDLGVGLLAEDDPRLDDSDTYPEAHRAEVPFLPGATYYFIGATITRDRHHPLGRILGDLLVQYPSASGADRRRHIPFELANGTHVGGLTHFDLLNHPSVYHQLHEWLTRAARNPNAAGRISGGGAGPA
jgi:pimeloyl-ACP methyl ester carboxylesterase